MGKRLKRFPGGKLTKPYVDPAGLSPQTRVGPEEKMKKGPQLRNKTGRFLVPPRKKAEQTPARNFRESRTGGKLKKDWEDKNFAKAMNGA